MILETIFTLILSVIAIIFLFIMLALLMFLYIIVNSALYDLSWLITFYRIYRPDKTKLKELWKDYLKQTEKVLNNEIIEELKVYDPKEWENQKKK